MGRKEKVSKRVQAELLNSFTQSGAYLLRHSIFQCLITNYSIVVESIFGSNGGKSNYPSKPFEVSRLGYRLIASCLGLHFVKLHCGYFRISLLIKSTNKSLDTMTMFWITRVHCVCATSHSISRKYLINSWTQVAIEEEEEGRVADGELNRQFKAETLALHRVWTSHKNPLLAQLFSPTPAE